MAVHNTCAMLLTMIVTAVVAKEYDVKMECATFCDSPCDELTGHRNECSRCPSSTLCNPQAFPLSSLDENGTLFSRMKYSDEGVRVWTSAAIPLDEFRESESWNDGTIKLALSGSDSDDEWHSPLSYAVVYGGFDEMLEKSTSDPNVATCGWRNLCASHFAAAIGNLTMIKRMHDLNLDVWGNSFVRDPKHVTNPLLGTPAHVAAQHGHVEVVKFLSASRIPPNTVDGLGSTVFQRAAAYGQTEIMDMLLTTMNDDVDVAYRDPSNLDSMVYASMIGDTKGVELIRMHMPKE
jgi:hypothetical protein